jgi:outer membrane protein TolC
MAVVCLLVSVPPARGLSQATETSEPSIADQDVDRTFSGELDKYVEFALRHHPTLLEQYSVWKQQQRSVTSVGAWPEPMLTYTVLPIPIETRVGPQRHRLGVTQRIPWPGARSAAELVQSTRAEQAKATYDARMITLRRRVAEVYWQRWRVERAIHWQQQQLALLRTIEAAVRARVETGGAPASQLHQLAVEQTQVSDNIDGLESTRQALAARFQQMLGLSGDGAQAPVTPVARPSASRPVRDVDDMVESARRHPDVLAVEKSLRAAQRELKHQKLENAPDLQVGAMWMETGQARMPGVDDSGKDPISVTVGVNLPVWLGANKSKVDAIQAKTEARRAAVRAAKQKAEAQTRATLARVRESARRIRRYRTTLLPQAETAVESVLGQYESGKASFASILAAQKRLLSLRLNLAEARARHAQHWARLEALVGQPLERTDWNDE